MGMFSVAINKNGERFQFKGGNDFLDEYNIGDEIPFSVDPEKMNSACFADGIYDAYKEKDDVNGLDHIWWVVIKDKRLHDIVRTGGHWKDDSHYRDALDLLYKITEEYKRSLYSETCWQDYEEKEAKRQEEFNKATEGMSSKEQFAFILSQPDQSIIYKKVINDRN